MTVDQLQKEVHARCLSFRAIDRLVQSKAFEEACQLDFDNERMQTALIIGELDVIEEWITETLTREVGEWSLRELRERASQVGVKNYTSYNKETLLILLVQHDRQVSKTTDRLQVQ